MKGDFSRVTFKADKQFSQVLLQQGRVLLDADFNEQGAIYASALRRLTRDLLGPHAGPEDDLGFEIGSSNGEITIGFGRYYVDGLPAVNVPPPPDATKTVAPLFYQAQPGYPFAGSVEAKDLKVGTAYFFYLDVWEQPVTWMEDDSIREVALGGPDTAMRAQVVWRVRAVSRPGGAFDPEKWLDQNVQRHSRLNPGNAGAMLPQLKAWTDPKDNPDETPCVADPLGGYRGLENQLYRVEIHTDGADGGLRTFKWSRDNGSVMAAWEATDGNQLIVAGVRDRAHGFAAGQWVELTNEISQLKSSPGVMVRLVKVERERLTFDLSSASGTIPVVKQLLNPIVRRWDQHEGKDYKIEGGAVVLEEDKVYALERGVQICFRKQTAGGRAVQYLNGDYWLIPARTASGDIEWPYHVAEIDGQPQKVYEYSDPGGVYHAYAPLAVVTPKAGAPLTFDIVPLQRKIIQLWS
jgi:hypothetical protein